jgi:hypothetical protein
MGRLKLFGEPEGGGTNDHSALSNLGYAQSGHTGFVPSQGEALIDILRLNQNLIRDSAGNNRLQLAATSPHVAITGDLDVSQHGAFGSGASPATGRILNLDGSVAATPAVALYGRVYGNAAGGLQLTVGVSGAATGQGTPLTALVYGLYFYAAHDTPSPCTTLCSSYTIMQSGASGTGSLATAVGILLGAAGWLGSKPNVVTGIQIDQQGGSGVGTAYGLRIVDQTAASVRLLEIGPSSPYLRLVGGGNPPADKSNLYLKFGSTLYRVVKTGTSMTLEAA